MEKADKSTPGKGETESATGQWGACKLCTEVPAEREASGDIASPGCSLLLALKYAGVGSPSLCPPSMGLERHAVDRVVFSYWAR